jgi:catechol 2,3-dioxygenase-like lactoylglutathione lyase family enzyme
MRRTLARIGRCSLVFFLFTFALASTASAQGYRPIVDHVHLAAPDPGAAVAWYQKYFGGKTMAEAADRLLIGDVRIIFSKRDSALPSQGSAVDHIGFSVANLDDAMKAFQSDGVKVVTPARDVPGLFPLAFIEDPWGTRVEVVQDSATLGLHHIHLRGADPAAMLAWYSTQFGGRTGKLKDRIDGIDMGGVWILFQRGDAVPSQGHSIDHIGFRPLDVDAAVAELKSRMVKITTEPRPLTFANGVTVRLAFAEAPDGVRIELVQRPE